MTQISRSRSRLFFHSACVLYSRRSGNPNPNMARRGAAESESTAANLDSRPAGPHSRDERTRMLGVSASAKSATSLVARTELRTPGSEHYIHFTPQARSRIVAPSTTPAGGRRCYHTTRRLRARSPVCTLSQWLAPALVPHSLSHLPSTWTMAFIVSPGSAHQ